MIVDLFAGGGGASVGIEAATGEEVDVAINHSPVAMAVHAVNHPGTQHLITSVWDVKPKTAVGHRTVDLLWASPDCTHFSNAKGGKPRDAGIRSLAWVVVDWARDVAPTVICVENVPEFLKWGPLYPSDHPIENLRGTPIKEREGETFAQWTGALELLGYKVDHQVLDASHFGAPTRRRRLFVVARRDGRPIVFPKPTHGPGLQAYRTAAECIDFSLDCPSIFGRKKPLAEKTLWRVAQGIKKFVKDNPSPFLIQVNHGKWEPRASSIHQPLSTITASRRGVAVVAPVLVQTGYGERPGQRPRYLNLQAPLGTVVADGRKHALVQAFLVKHFGDPRRKKGGGAVLGSDLRAPIGTDGQNPAGELEQPLPVTTAGGVHVGLVTTFLRKYQALGADELPLVTIDGVDYEIADVGLRMLQPHELLAAQFGRFAADYDLSAAATKEAKVRLIGNSVCPEVAEAPGRIAFVVLVVTPAELAQMKSDWGEYSCTLPSGAFIGKRWLCDLSFGKPRGPGGLRKPEWWMGEYVPHVDPEKVGIQWTPISVEGR